MPGIFLTTKCIRTHLVVFFVLNGNKRIAGRGISRLALLRTYPYNSVPLRTGRMSSVSEPQACTALGVLQLITRWSVYRLLFA